MQTILEIVNFLERNTSERMHPENHDRASTAPSIVAAGRHGREIDALIAHHPHYVRFLGDNTATMSTCSDIGDVPAGPGIEADSPSCSSISSSQDSLPLLNSCALTSQAASLHRHSQYRSITSGSLESIPETTRCVVPVISSLDTVPRPQWPNPASFETKRSEDSKDEESMKLRKALSTHQPSNTQYSSISASSGVSPEPSQKMTDPQGGGALQIDKTQNYDESRLALQKSVQGAGLLNMPSVHSGQVNGARTESLAIMHETCAGASLLSEGLLPSSSSPAVFFGSERQRLQAASAAVL